MNDMNALQNTSGQNGAAVSSGAATGGCAGRPDPDFIQDCLIENEHGDGRLFKALFGKQFIYNKSIGMWMTWEDHHWALDYMDDALASVEAVARVYQDEAMRLSGDRSKLNDDDDKPHKDRLSKLIKELNNRAKALRASNRRRNCLEFAHSSGDGLAVRGDELDKKPWLFACANGVINLRTGEMDPGRQKDMLLKASPVEWQGIDAPCPTWEKTIMDIFSDRQQLVDCFQRICGYAMVGEIIQSVFVVMTGKGRNGKSLIVETINKVMGPMAASIRSEMLLDQFRVPSSAGPSPDIMGLQGLRMAFGSETDDGCRISPSRVKWLTGKDTIRGRNPHDKFEQEFLPSHLLFLLTNHKPHAPAEDFAFWERMLLIPFELSFVDRDPEASDERRADPFLGDKLDKELPGILAWMVKGCLIWQQQGIDPPTIVKAAVADYQREEDTLSDFIDECCILGEQYSVGATAAYAAFEKWWQTNVSKNAPKQKRFGTWFSKRFEKRKDGTMKYFGVALLAEDADQPMMPFS